MMRIRCLVVVFCGLPWMLGADEPPAWNEFSSGRGTFQVLLPDAPVEQNVVQNGQSVHLVTADGELANDLYFMIVTMELPQQAAIRRQADAERALEGSVAAYRERPDLTFIGAKPIALGSTPGREILADGLQGKLVRCHIFIVGTRSYSLMALSTDPELLRSDKANRFFDSFEILGLPATPLSEHSAEYLLGKIIGAGIVNLAIVAVVVAAIVVYLRRQKKTAP